jgi:hypothetical protein
VVALYVFFSSIIPSDLLRPQLVGRKFTDCFRPELAKLNEIKWSYLEAIMRLCRWCLDRGIVAKTTLLE